MTEPRYKPASHVVEDDFKVGTVQACNRCGVSYIEGYMGDCQEQYCGGEVVSFGDPADVARKMETAHQAGRQELEDEINRAAWSIAERQGFSVSIFEDDPYEFVQLTDDDTGDTFSAANLTAALRATEESEGDRG